MRKATAKPDSTETTSMTEVAIEVDLATLKPSGRSKPATAVEALDSFARQFLIVDKAGNPITDQETGEPQFEDVFYLAMERVICLYCDSQLADLVPRLEANEYASEAEREYDNDLMTAVGVIGNDLRKQDESEKRRKLASIRKAGERAFWHQVTNLVNDHVDRVIDSLRKAGAISSQWPFDGVAPNNSFAGFKEAIGAAVEAGISEDQAAATKLLGLEIQYLKEPSAKTIQARIIACREFFLSRDVSGQTFLYRAVERLIRDGWAD